MSAPAPKPPLLARLLLSLARLGDRRADVEADVTDLYQARTSVIGRPRATLRMVADIVSVWRWPLGRWARDLSADMKQGLRLMRRSPAFTVTAALVLSLGIGVNTALFSVINSLFFSPLPVKSPDELFYLYSKNEAGQVEAYVDRDFVIELEQRGADLAELTQHWRVPMRLTANELTEVAYGEWVDINYFDLLGVRTVLGRALQPEDADPATPGLAVVISHDLWTRRFKSDPNVLGQTIRLNAVFATIVGVSEAGFKGVTDPFTPTGWWAPGAKAQAAADGRSARFQRYIAGPIGRLKPGVSFEQYQAFLSSVVPEWKVARTDFARANSKTPENFERWRRSIAASSYPAYRATETRMPFKPEGRLIPSGLLAGMVAVVALVLLIAAANIAGLLMARGVARTGEVAVRRALGAGVARLSRQLMTEGVTLALAGGALGLFVAHTLIGLFRAYTPSRFTVDVSLDWRVLLFAVVVCIGAGVLVGLAPALQAARVNVLEALSNGVVGTRRVRARLRHWIVIPQVALTMLMLLVAGVHARTLLQVERANPGYSTDGVVVMTIGRWEPENRNRGYSAAEQEAYARKVRQFQREALARVTQLPQVMAVSLAGDLPVAERAGLSSVVSYEDYVANAQPRGSARGTIVSDGYFDTLSMRLRDGRLFDERDGMYEQFGPRVAVISEQLAHAVWPAGNAVGRTFTMLGDNPAQKVEWFEVVGVVNDVEAVLSDREKQPRVYLPVKQQWQGFAPNLLVKGSGSQDQLIRDVKSAVLGADTFAEVSQVRTMDQVVAEILYPRRLAAAMLVAGALIGLVLSCIGLYGVVSYSVAQRVREIGIRATLGAESGDIVRLVLSEGVRVAGIGIAIGFAGAIVVLRTTAGMLPQLPQTDTVSFIVVPLILAAMVVIACLVPAWRAARVDPAAVLRA
jgi:putative ABC transport system permease protein